MNRILIYSLFMVLAILSLGVVILPGNMVNMVSAQCDDDAAIEADVDLGKIVEFNLHSNIATLCQ